MEEEKELVIRLKHSVCGTQSPQNKQEEEGEKRKSICVLAFNAVSHEVKRPIAAKHKESNFKNTSESTQLQDISSHNLTGIAWSSGVGWG